MTVPSWQIVQVVVVGEQVECVRVGTSLEVLQSFVTHGCLHLVEHVPVSLLLVVAGDVAASWGSLTSITLVLHPTPCHGHADVSGSSSPQSMATAIPSPRHPLITNATSPRSPVTIKLIFV